MCHAIQCHGFKSCCSLLLDDPSVDNRRVSAVAETTRETRVWLHSDNTNSFDLESQTFTDVAEVGQQRRGRETIGGG